MGAAGANGAVTIRPLRADDAAAMAGVLASPDLYVHTGGVPPTGAQLLDLYGRQSRGWSPDGSEQWLNWVVLDEAGLPAGYVQASRPAGGTTAQVAWVVGVPWQGRGVATRAVRLVQGELASLGIGTVTADIHPDNLASQIVARRVGLSPTSEVVDGELRWTGPTTWRTGTETGHSTST